MTTLEHESPATPDRAATAEGEGEEGGSSAVIDLRDDALSPARGIVTSAVLSLPVWAALATVAWKIRH